MTHLLTRLRNMLNIKIKILKNMKNEKLKPKLKNQNQIP